MENVLEASALQDALMGALIGLVRAADGSSYGLGLPIADGIVRGAQGKDLDRAC